MADTTEPLFQLVDQQTGGNNNSWGDIADANFLKIADKVAAVKSKAVSGGTTALTDDEQRARALKFTGVLGSNQIVTVNDAEGVFIVKNGTTGSFTFTVATDTGSGIAVPQGEWRTLYSDGTNIILLEANGPHITQLTDGQVKTAYENNADTNEFSDAEKTKLTNIQANATVDQSDAEIKTAYENNANTNVFSDALLSKLNDIQANAVASVKWVIAETTAFTSTTKIVTADNSKPQLSEMAVIATTPNINVASGDQVEIHFNANVYYDDSVAIVGVFRNDNHGALRVITVNGFASLENAFNATGSFIDTPGSGTFAYSVAFSRGSGGPSTAYLNGQPATGLYNGAYRSGIRLRVIT